MTRHIDTLASIASEYDAIVLDQWGVLHDGTTPYPNAISCLQNLAAHGQRFAVLSNSGKRAVPNLTRIAGMGFDPKLFASIMTSGEALWRDIADNRIAARRFFAIERASEDATDWAQGLDVTFAGKLEEADAVLLMGLPDGATVQEWEPVLQHARELGLPIYCSNPDRASPRSAGLVVSPGALAFAYRDAGGEVVFYGKPHRPIFDAVEHSLGTKRLLMVGDSLEHDIAGAQGAGWDSLLVRSGLYAADFAAGARDQTLANLVAAKRCAPPTYTIGDLT